MTMRSRPIGARRRSRQNVTSGRFLELLPGRRVRQSVEFESDDPAFTADMRMTWSYDPAVEGTRVTVTADDVPNGIRKADHDEGLRSSLDNLAAFVEHPLMDSPVRGPRPTFLFMPKPRDCARAATANE